MGPLRGGGVTTEACFFVFVLSFTQPARALLDQARFVFTSRDVVTRTNKNARAPGLLSYGEMQYSAHAEEDVRKRWRGQKVTLRSVGIAFTPG